MPVVLEDEVRTLTQEAGRIGVKLRFVPYGEHNGVKLYKWVIEGWCPFFKGKCTIHEKKPLSCRMYPLLLNLKTGDIYLSEKCLYLCKHSMVFKPSPGFRRVYLSNRLPLGLLQV